MNTIAHATAAHSDVPAFFPTRELFTLHQERVRVPDPSRLVHLQLRRFAGCPICNLHLRSFRLRHEELVQADVLEVVVFYSSADDLRQVHTELPFPIVPDPKKELYAELGVGTSLQAMLDPRAWRAAARALVSGASPAPHVGVSDGSWGLPGDFLIAPSGCILAHHRGVHADDQWSFDELLAIVAQHQAGL